MKKIFYTILFLLIFSVLSAQDMLILADTTGLAKVELGEIVVNASRNSTLIKNMPTSITMIDAKQVTNNNIQTLEDVNLIAPNFFMVNYGSKLTSPVYIRGIGSKKHSPAVGLYVDGVPFFEIASMNFDFFDISKIEVLRGPQGTLFGRNTMGGLINIKTLSPINYQGTRIRLSAGQYGTYNATAGYYNKLNNNKFAYSLTANYRYNSGVFKNQQTNDMSDKLMSYGMRSRLAYQVNDNFLIENIASFENSKEYGYSYNNLKTNEIDYNEEGAYNRIMFNDGLRFDYNNSAFNLGATLSYQSINDKQKMDQDFTSVPLAFAEQDGTQDMLSAECIIGSKKEQQYRWLFGTFAFWQDKDILLDVIIRPHKLTLRKDYDSHVLSGGIFHQSEVTLFDNLTLTAGVRYNYEQSSLDYKYTQLKQDKLVRTVADTLFPSLKEHIFLPKVSVTYKVSKALFYCQYSTGYKSGGFNLTFERPQDLHFEKQMSQNYEVGYKQTFLRGKIYTDVALFWSDITGQQIAHAVKSGQGTYFNNAGKSQNKGIEVSVTVADIKGFSLNASYGYTHAEILKYQKNDTLDYSGNRAPYVPLHTANIGLAKTFKFTNNNFFKSLRVQTDYKQMGHIYWRIENDFEQKSYGLLNASISLSTKFFTIDFWAKNITKQTYNVYMFHVPQIAPNIPANTFYQKGRPQMFGTTLLVSF